MPWPPLPAPQLAPHGLQDCTPQLPSPQSAPAPVPAPSSPLEAAAASPLEAAAAAEKAAAAAAGDLRVTTPKGGGAELAAVMRGLEGEVRELPRRNSSKGERGWVRFRGESRTELLGQIERGEPRRR